MSFVRFIVGQSGKLVRTKGRRERLDLSNRVEDREGMGEKLHVFDVWRNQSGVDASAKECVSGRVVVNLDFLPDGNYQSLLLREGGKAFVIPCVGEPIPIPLEKISFR